MRVDILANGRAAWVRDLRPVFASRGRDIGRAIRVREVDARGRGDAPLIYLRPRRGGGTGSDAFLRRALERGRFVLPVVEDARRAASLPAPLTTVNAFLQDHFPGAWADAVADEILSRLWVGRAARKVFLSYKRTDSERAAKQLHTTLVNLGFDVFLDDVSIPRGVDFQRSLRFWLNDADLVLALVTPGFAESRWIREEIAFAASAGLGVRAIIWPQVPARLGRKGAKARRLHDLVRSFYSTHTIALDQSDLGRGRLTETAIRRIVQLTVRARSQALARRLHTLVRFARRSLRRDLAPGGTVRQSGKLGDLVLTEGERSTLVQVLPYRPGLEAIVDVQERARRQGAFSEVGCFYMENDPLQPSIKALRWAVDGHRGRPRPRLWWASGGLQT